jgi:hypothetical protein
MRESRPKGLIVQNAGTHLPDYMVSRNMNLSLPSKKSQNRPDGIATGYVLDGRGSIPDSGKRFFAIPQCSVADPVS